MVCDSTTMYPSKPELEGTSSLTAPLKPPSAGNVRTPVPTSRPLFSYTEMAPCTASAPVLTIATRVGDELDTFGKINRRDTFDDISLPSRKLSPESNIIKQPFTAGEEADSSTQPVCPAIPLPNISTARNAFWLDAGRVSVTG